MAEIPSSLCGAQAYAIGADLYLQTSSLVPELCVGETGVRTRLHPFLFPALGGAQPEPFASKLREIGFAPERPLPPKWYLLGIASALDKAETFAKQGDPRNAWKYVQKAQNFYSEWRGSSKRLQDPYFKARLDKIHSALSQNEQVVFAALDLYRDWERSQIPWAGEDESKFPAWLNGKILESLNCWEFVFYSAIQSDAISKAEMATAYRQAQTEYQDFLERDKQLARIAWNSEKSYSRTDYRSRWPEIEGAIFGKNPNTFTEAKDLRPGDVVLAFGNHPKEDKADWDLDHHIPLHVALYIGQDKNGTPLTVNLWGKDPEILSLADIKTRQSEASRQWVSISFLRPNWRAGIQ